MVVLGGGAVSYERGSPVESCQPRWGETIQEREEEVDAADVGHHQH